MDKSDYSNVRISDSVEDSLWDDFLCSTPEGQYQQSSLWARFKAMEGWRCERVAMMSSKGIVGGFQILWKKRGPAGLGYVSKGPVAHTNTRELRLKLCQSLAKAASKLKLGALVVQLPDQATESFAQEYSSLGFIQSNPMRVIESTYLVDVHEGMEPVRRRMHRNVRQCVRKAHEQGVAVRAGTEADLPLFFKLMSATCARQNTIPNPATVESLRLLWRLFASRGAVEMAFAGRDGQWVAGRMNLIFGNRVTQWKKGWDGTRSEWHPNELLADHALEWAHAQGYRFCDFSAINRLTAERILSGLPTNEGIARSRDMFNLRLGGYPQLLPRAQIYLPNPVIRLGYRQIYRRWELRRSRQMANQ